MKIAANEIASKTGEFMGKENLEFKGIGFNVANEIFDWGQEKLAEGEQWTYEQIDIYRDTEIGGVRLGEIPLAMPGNPLIVPYIVSKLLGHEEKLIHLQSGQVKGVVGAVFDTLQLAVDVVQSPYELGEYVTDIIESEDPVAKIIQDALQEAEMLKKAPAAMWQHIEESSVDFVNASPERQSELIGILSANIALMFVGAGELKLLKGADDLMSTTRKILAEAEIKDVKPPIGEIEKPKVDLNAGIKGRDEVSKGGSSTKGIKSWDEINTMLEKEGVNQAKIDEILNTPKGSRPDPSTYLSEDYINQHLSNFQNGVTKIKSKAPVDTEGVGLGTFVMPKSVADDVISRAAGEVSKLEELLGLNPGDLGLNPVRVDIANPQNIRVPSGNEVGAWPGYWTPGGYTKPGGVIEAVIDPVPKSDYVVIKNILEK